MAVGVELTDINWIALVIAFVAAVVLGFIWYSPKLPTGRIWMREMKFDASTKPNSKQMARGLILMIIGTFFLMFVFQHNFLAYRDSYRLDKARLDTAGLTMADGLMGGLFTWMGFFLPVGLSSIGWENKTWSLFFVNQGYYLVNMLMIGAIYASFI